MKRLRELILGKDWQGLDRFPGWTMDAVNPTVGAITRKATKQSPETAVGTPSGAPNEAWPAQGSKVITEYLDLGSYSPDKAEMVKIGRAHV